MRPIESLNEGTLRRDEFAQALKPLFEAAVPLADALYEERPFASYAELIDRAEALSREMPFGDQTEILAAHPRIGAPPTSVSDLSYLEQGYASEVAADPELERVYAELERLNRDYESRFGFRFVVFVNKRPKSEIVNVLKARLGNAREDELATSLREMFRIARDRLGTDSMQQPTVQSPIDDPAHQALLEALRRLAIETYGEERAAEATLQAAIGVAATAVWRVSQEPLDPSDDEP